MAEQQLTAGTWVVDPAHTEIGFTVRHMMVSRVRGRFERFDATLEVAQDPFQSKATATIDATSITTNNQQRDDHIRSADFFHVEQFPEFTFASTDAVQKGDDYFVIGDLTIKGNTRQVELLVEFNGSTRDPYGLDRAGFHAETEISRKEFGVDIELPMDGGGVVVADKIKIEIDAEFTRQEG